MNKLIIGLAAGLLVIILVFGVSLKFKANNISSNSVNSVEDKCKIPAGVDESSWKEHMGHHPDIYEGCL